MYKPEMFKCPIRHRGYYRNTEVCKLGVYNGLYTLYCILKVYLGLQLKCMSEVYNVLYDILVHVAGIQCMQVSGIHFSVCYIVFYMKSEVCKSELYQCPVRYIVY